ncbi:MAG: DUF58 domain-containing protein [Gemmatimonadaceae bacterium]
MPPATSYGPLRDALRGATWPARRVARATASGSHPSRLLGSSPEFTEYRLYRQGEDPRRLDWKLLARTDRAYLRITTDRATLATAIVLDASASMAFPEEGRGATTKWEQACRLAVGLLAVAHAAGDPVGLYLATAAGLRALPPRSRRGTVDEAARLLEGVSPRGSAPLAPVLALVPPGQRVALVSDFLGDAEELRRAAAARATEGAEVHAVHVVAAEELRPAVVAGLVSDPEDPTVQRPVVEATRAAYERAFGEWRAELARRWRAAGVAYVEVATDEGAAHAVRRVIHPPGDARAPTGR